jgi:hypothetical protein
MKTNYSNQQAAWTLMLIACVGLLTVLVPADGFGKQTSEPPQWDAYKIIVNQNMFSRNRRPPIDPNAKSRYVVPDPNLESYYVLRGIAREDGTFIAFFQDNRQGGTLRLREGGQVAHGTIKSITLDSLEYQFGQRTRLIQIGYDLDGGKGAASSDSSSRFSSISRSQGSQARDSRSRQDRFSSSRRDRGTSVQSSGASAASSSEISGEDEAEILRRLMERRQQQLGENQ